MEVVWKQEDYDGRLITLTKKFNSRQEFEEWKKEMHNSAKYIGKIFEIIEIRE